MPALAPKIDQALNELGDRAVGAYLGLAVGDALGATVEFMTPREIQNQFGEHRDITGGGWLRLKPGHVTDDTEMSLALGNAILSAQGVDALYIAQAFDAWLKTKPVDVGNTVRRGIVRFRTHGTTQAVMDDFDAGNGAVMRVLPVALASLGAKRETVALAAQTQAHVTHNAPLADAGMMAVVHMTQRALKGGVGTYRDMIGMAHELELRSKKYVFTNKPEQNPSGFLPDTLRAVFQSFTRTDGFEAALIDVVNRGGDADTTGAILGFIAGALYGQDAIPARWLNALDGGVRQACEDQALKLLKMSPLISAKPLDVQS